MTRPVVIALVGFIAAVAAVALFLSSQREERAGALDGDSPAAIADAIPTPGPATDAPSFDVVRIGEGGDAVIAGRAVPRAEVVILDGGKEIGRVTADARGEWVFVPAVPMAPGARELVLEAHNPDGSVVRSGDPVILVVPDRPGLPALAVRRSAAGGGRVLQGPAGDASGPLAVDMVDHEAGRLFVAGRAEPGATVQVYLDNRLLGRAKADADGNWQVSAQPPAKGGRVLRVDQVDGKGKVAARVEAPYEPAAGASPPPGSVVVQPGNSLWRIARGIYGSGPAYTVIYEANKSQIRDPDLIYPGQVLTMPR